VGALHVRAVVLPGAVERDLYVAGGCYVGPEDGCPRVITAGRFLAPPGGYFPGLAREIPAGELPDAAEDEARASGAWVQLIGDFPGPDGRLRANWPSDVLAEATRRVHALGGQVAMHVMTEPVIQAAIDAGADSIEHGTGMMPDQINAMAARGTAWVPTLTRGGAGPAVAFA